MAAEYGAFARGGVEFPLTAATTNSLLKDADPVLYGALDYFAAMLAQHAGARFAAAASAAGLTDPSGAAISSIVGGTLPFPADWYLTSDQVQFPVLCAYRTTQLFNERTVVLEHSMTEIHIEYVLPPLSVAQAEQIMPILNAVAAIISDRSEQGADPSYTPPFTGYTAGLSVWKATGLELVEVRQGRFGKWDAGDGLVFPGWTCEMHCQERTKVATGQFAAMSRIDLDEQLAAEDTVTYDHALDTSVNT